MGTGYDHTTRLTWILLTHMLLYGGLPVTWAAAALTPPVWWTEPAPIDGERQTYQALSLRVDCPHEVWADSSPQDRCLELSSLKIRLGQTLHHNLWALLVLDPLSSPLDHMKSQFPSPWRPQNHDLPLPYVDLLQLEWTPILGLHTRLETYAGPTALPPSMRMLSHQQPFASTGWDQLVLSTTWDLSSPWGGYIKWAMGNGEGTYGVSPHVSKYLGLEGVVLLRSGLYIKTGLSMDPNHGGTPPQQWLAKRYRDTCGIPTESWDANYGHSTRRGLISLYSPGTMPELQGMSFGIAWHQSLTMDREISHDGGPGARLLTDCDFLDEGSFFFEDPTHASITSLKRTSIGGSWGYWLMDTVQIVGDLQRQVSRAQGFSFLKTASQEAVPTLTQVAYSLGAVYRLDHGLLLSLEYHKAFFDESYEHFYYGPSGSTKTPRSKSFGFINGRIQYNP